MQKQFSITSITGILNLDDPTRSGIILLMGTNRNLIYYLTPDPSLIQTPDSYQRDRFGSDSGSGSVYIRIRIRSSPSRVEALSAITAPESPAPTITKSYFSY